MPICMPLFIQNIINMNKINTNPLWPNSPSDKKLPLVGSYKKLSTIGKTEEIREMCGLFASKVPVFSYCLLFFIIL